MKNRIVYLDIIKILAIILVIFNHTHWYIRNDSFFVGTVHYFLFCLCKVAVPLFIMVSGALLLERKNSYNDIFRKRIPRLLVPLIIIIAISSIIYRVSYQEVLKLLFTDFINNSSKGPYWAWYIFVIMSLYFMTPLIQKMIKDFDRKDYIILIILSVFGVGLVNESGSIFNVLLGENLALNNHLPDAFLPIAVGYYVLGHFLHNQKVGFKLFVISMCCLIISLVSGTLLLRLGMIRNIGFDDMLKYNYFIIAVASTSIFIIVKYLFEKSVKSEKICEVISDISNSVFGVYLFHVFIIIILRKTQFFIDAFAYNSFIGVLLLIVFTFAILVLVIYLMRRIPLLKKFL